MAGYHLYEIPRGKIGDFSKVVEEFLEFEDAVEQNCAIMALVELADLVGSIKQFYTSHQKEDEWDILLKKLLLENRRHPVDYEDLRENFSILNEAVRQGSWNSFEVFLVEIVQYLSRYNLDMKDLISMSNITERVFKNGYRTSREN